MRHNFVVATAEWATQQSDPDFTPIDAISVLDLLLGYNNVAIVKEKKEIKQRKKRKDFGGGVFWRTTKCKNNDQIFLFSGKWQRRAVSSRPTCSREFMTLRHKTQNFV